ncbi:MAG: hypothetical protein ACLVJO_06070 [[Clostridium] scindens]
MDCQGDDDQYQLGKYHRHKRRYGYRRLTDRSSSMENYPGLAIEKEILRIIL